MFNVTAGSHTITFQALNSGGGDNAVLTARPNPSKSLIADAGFEQVSVGAGQFQLQKGGPIG
jgi:hypothetical protein